VKRTVFLLFLQNELYKSNSARAITAQAAASAQDRYFLQFIRYRQVFVWPTWPFDLTLFAPGHNWLSCRVNIIQSSCIHNLAVEKAISELPVEQTIIEWRRWVTSNNAFSSGEELILLAVMLTTRVIYHRVTSIDTCCQSVMVGHGIRVHLTRQGIAKRAIFRKGVTMVRLCIRPRLSWRDLQ